MTLPHPPRTTLVPGPDGDLEVLTTGRGEPHTLFVHGLAGSISTTRPYASAVAGTRRMRMVGPGRVPGMGANSCTRGHSANSFW